MFWISLYYRIIFRNGDVDVKEWSCQVKRRDRPNWRICWPSVGRLSLAAQEFSTFSLLKSTKFDWNSIFFYSFNCVIERLNYSEYENVDRISFELEMNGRIRVEFSGKLETNENGWETGDKLSSGIGEMSFWFRTWRAAAGAAAVHLGLGPRYGPERAAKRVRDAYEHAIVIASFVSRFASFDVSHRNLFRFSTFFFLQVQPGGLGGGSNFGGAERDVWPVKTKLLVE